MATTTITTSKFGVPLTGNTGSGIMMPTPKNRFRVSFLNNFGGLGETRVVTQNVSTVQRPTFVASPVEVRSYNSIMYYQGLQNWEVITVAIRDDITKQVTKAVGAQIQRQFNHFQQTTPAAASDYKFDMQIEVLDGVNAGATEVWYLEGCWLTNTAYGDHDYNSAEPQLITLSVRYDNATHYEGENDINGRLAAGSPFDPNASGGTTGITL
jgi:hypothetical protein